MGCKQTTITEKTPEESSSTPEENTPTEYLQQSAGLCGSATFFMESVSRFSNDSNSFIIKGTVLDKIERTSLKIRLVEDLKGNFPDKVNTFFVWGASNTIFAAHFSLDYILMHENQDVLIMHLTPARVQLEEFIPQGGYTWLEKKEDYTTLPCTFSVLKLSDGNVTGYIYPPKILDDRKWDDLSSEEQTSILELVLSNNLASSYKYLADNFPSQAKEYLQGIFTAMHTERLKEETMPWEDFQKELNKLLIIK